MLTLIAAQPQPLTWSPQYIMMIASWPLLADVLYVGRYTGLR
jgi:hypothetical protein